MIERGIVQQDRSGLCATSHHYYDGYGKGIDKLAFFTTGRTQGLLSSSRYAPTPTLIFCGNVSALYDAVNWKILSDRVQNESVRVLTSPGYRGVPVWRSERYLLP